MAKIINPTIKKELSKEEFEQLLNSYKKEISNCDDFESVSTILENYTKALTPAHMVHLIRVSQHPKKEDNTLTLSVESIGQRGLIGQCLNKKEALYTNDVNRDPYYDHEIDNPFS
ncbi:MAG: hypothetical protein C6H99_00540, partial [Epsilonproteobacteria bacterium]|nr:hypothetical protein [Campylobacterota bacterium]NPA63740.1 hypothetical protein [Campylobacterota bacterium]